MRAPYFVKGRGWLIEYRKANGKWSKKKIGNTKSEAMAAFKSMQAITDNPTVISVASKMLKHYRDRVKIGELAETYVERLADCLSDFMDRTRRWDGFTKEEVTTFANDRYESAGMIRTFLTHCRTLSSYGYKHHGLKDMMSGLQKPQAQSRLKLMTEEEYREIIDGAFKSNRPKEHRFALLAATFWHTGARPGELVKAKRSDLQGNKIVLQKHKNTRRTIKPRVIYLNAAARIAVEMAANDSEYLFVNSKDNPWNARSFNHRVKYVVAERNLDSQICPYAFRHSFATRALAKGVDIATLAELMGTSIKMIQDNYGHLNEMEDHLSSLVERI